MSFRFPRHPLVVFALVIASGAGLATVAVGAMRSEKLEPQLCKTTGGGKFVAIPGFPGERIDRRLLRDIEWMRRKYKILITDGYSTDPVHSAKGEHPIGLALDIVPNKAGGGNWRDIGRLADWAEPARGEPRPPFRWVGYNGDAGHGRGHHLHLSYGHSKARFGKPTRIAYSVKCTRGTTAPDPKGPGTPDSGGQQPGGGTAPGNHKQAGKRSEGHGGVGPGLTSVKTAKRKLKRQARRTNSVETGGLGLG